MKYHTHDTMLNIVHKERYLTSASNIVCRERYLMSESNIVPTERSSTGESNIICTTRSRDRCHQGRDRVEHDDRDELKI